jgi:hypothetical protein
MIAFSAKIVAKLYGVTVFAINAALSLRYAFYVSLALTTLATPSINKPLSKFLGCNTSVSPRRHWRM